MEKLRQTVLLVISPIPIELSIQIVVYAILGFMMMEKIIIACLAIIHGIIISLFLILTSNTCDFKESFSCLTCLISNNRIKNENND